MVWGGLGQIFNLHTSVCRYIRHKIYPCSTVEHCFAPEGSGRNFCGTFAALLRQFYVQEILLVGHDKHLLLFIQHPSPRMRDLIVDSKAKESRQRFITSIDQGEILKLASSYHDDEPCHVFRPVKHGSYNV